MDNDIHFLTAQSARAAENQGGIPLFTSVKNWHHTCCTLVIVTLCEDIFRLIPTAASPSINRPTTAGKPVEGICKMKMKYAYVVFGIVLVLSSNVFVMNLSAQVPGKQYISFSSLRTGKLDIYVIDTDGKDLRQLTHDPVAAHSAAWSPSGRAFAYVSHRDGNAEIYVMNLNTKEIHRLTDHPARDDNPVWSPDGKWIAFSSNREGNYDIYKMDVNGENLQRLIDEGKHNSAPAWSPDGKRLAFYSIRNEIGGNIYVMDVNRRNLIRLTLGVAPSWSPDGKQIAYYKGSGIYVINANGQNNRRVSPLETWSEIPAWSLDGRWIACQSELENPWGNPNRDSNIYLIPLKGAGKPRQITQHQAMDYSPAWVPSGFLAVSPTANTQTTLWSKLKQIPNTTK